MALSDEITALRKHYNDDEILGFMVQAGKAPQEEIDNLKQHYSPKEIVNLMAPSKGYGDALRYGVGSAVEGTGKSIKQTGRYFDSEGTDKFGQGVEEAGKTIKPENYRSGIQEFINPTADEAGLGGYGWGGIPRAAVEAAPMLGAALLTRNPYAAAGLYGATSLGENVEGRMANNNRDPNKDKATTGEFLAGGATTAGQAALGGLGVGKVAGPIQGSALNGLKQFAKGVGIEAGVGAGQDVIGQLGTSVGSEKGTQFDPNQTLGNALTQGLTTAGLKAPALARNAATAFELRGTDNSQNQATYAANLLRQVQENNPGLDIRNTKDTGTILEKAMALNTERINESMRKVKGMMEEANLRDAATELEGLRQNADSLAIIKDAKKKGGPPIGDEAINNIEKMVGSTAEGQLLVGSLRAQSALKALSSQGRKVGDNFIGGLASRLPLLEKVATSKLTHLLGLSGAAGTVLASSTPIVQGALASFIANPIPVIGAAAIPAGLYGGARALDAISGSRNPVNRFASRFADPTMGTAPDVGAPSITAMANQAKARQNAQNEAFRDLRNQRYDLVNQTLQQRLEHTPSLVESRLNKEASVADANRSRAAVNQAKAESIPILTEAQQGLVNERTATQAERTNTQREATRTQGERTAAAAANTETVKKTGEQKVAEATARKEAAQSRARAAKLREQIVQLRAEKAQARTEADKALADAKIKSAKAKLAKEQAKSKASKGSGKGSGKAGESQFGGPDLTTGVDEVPVYNKPAWQAGTLRQNNTLLSGINLFVETRHGMSKKLKAELSNDLSAMGRYNNRGHALSILEDVANKHSKYASEIYDHFYEGGPSNPDNIINRSFTHNTPEEANAAARRKRK
jgi:hypothetical protein